MRNHSNHNPLLLSMACLALATTTAVAQKMGHSNTHAPEITQVFRIGDKARMRLGYTSITWASGTWAKALADEKLRVGMRDRINSAAASDPLGSFESDTMVKIGGKSVPKGSYKLSFMLSDRFTWQLVLTGKRTIAVDLLFRKAAKERKRLTLNLDAGDANFTGSLKIVFGTQQCELGVVPNIRLAQKIPGILNTMCPLMDEPIDPEITVTHGDKKIGMCCEDCVDDWRKLSKEKKNAHVEKMLKK